MTDIISPLPFTLQNGTVADASQVQANFDQIVADVNNNHDGFKVYRGAVAYSNNNTTIPNTGVTTAVAFGPSVIDTDGIYSGSGVSNSNRLTVPAGITKVRLLAQARVTGATAGNSQITIGKNGTFSTTPFATITLDDINSTRQLVSSTFTVIPGDYFQLGVSSNGSVGTVVSGGPTWFEMQILG